jgi:hypothetical protein
MKLTYDEKLALGWSFTWRASLPAMIFGAVFGAFKVEIAAAVGMQPYEAYTFLSFFLIPVWLLLFMPWAAAAMTRIYEEKKHTKSEHRAVDTNP